MNAPMPSLIARPPSLRAITAFEAAARHQSFTKAAEELNLTHGAVGHAVRGLEARMGAPLFHRPGRSLQLTSEGRALAARIRLALGLLGEAFAPPGLGRAANVVVSASATVAARLLMPRMLRIGEELPNIAVRITTETGPASPDGDWDVRVHIGEGKWAGCHHQVLSGEVVYPVAAPGFADGRLPRDLDDLQRAPLIWDPASAWMLWLKAQGREPQDYRMLRIADEPGLALEAAALGLGVALARHNLVEPDLASGRLVRLPLPQAESAEGYCAAWNPASRNVQAVATFTQWLGAALGSPESRVVPLRA